MTNFRVLTEVDRKGLILDLNYNELDDYVCQKDTNSIRFSWTENIGHKMSIEMQCKDAQEAIAVIGMTKQDFDDLQKSASK
ncbi:MAG: hypothetical protein J4F36_13100 [Nitrosopumilaceae archaeon]|nr:hypothetical protein [Nitrosopumilaceae archaeon]